MRRIIVYIFSVILSLAIASTAAYCGQMSSHVYTALRARDFLSKDTRDLVNAHLLAYLAGAQGPDTTGVVMHGLDAYSKGNSVGEETHYDPKKAELALNILDSARDEVERAYAIGWITHYINDIYVHALVNEYGGYYAKAAWHHKELEQLETMYVITEHKDVFKVEYASQNYAGLGDKFAEFIFDGFHKTYPKNDLYKPEKKAYFCSRYQEAAGYSTDAHKVFYATATTKSQLGKHGWVKESNLFPPMPSFDDYDHFQHAIEITNVKAGKDKLTATVKINDDKCYGRFMVDWDTAVENSMADTRVALQALSAYMEAPAAQKAARRAALLATIPSGNLDQPKANFDHEKAFPGDKTRRTPYYTCTFTPMDAPENAKDVSGRLPDMTVKSTGWAGSEQGEINIEIPAPAGAYPYECILKVSLLGKDEFTNTAYEFRSWAQSTVSSDTTGDARVMVGEVFPVTINLSPALQKLPNKHIWLITSDEPNSRRINLAGKVKTSASQFTLSRQSLGKLPGNPEFMWQLGSERYDVAVVEEKLNGGVLTAKLQVSNQVLKHHLGAQKLVCVFLDHPQASSLEYYTAYKKWQASSKKAKPIWDMIDKKIESLSEANKKQLQAKGEKYLAELEKQGLSEEEKDRLMEKKFMELLVSVGLKITPAQQAILAQVAADDKAQEAKSNVYNALFAKFILQPSAVKVDMADGWKMEKRVDEEYVRYSLTKVVKSDSRSGGSLMYASGQMDITCTADPATEKKFLNEHKGGKEKRTDVKIGNFAGPLFTQSYAPDGAADSDFKLEECSDCLLKLGGMFIRVRYTVNGGAYIKRNGRGEVVEDGTAAARSAVTAMTHEADFMFKSVKLIAEKVNP